MRAEQATITTRLASPNTTDKLAPLLSKAEGPSAGGLYTPPPGPSSLPLLIVLVPAVLQKPIE
jgi:hypothetical protein